MMQRKRECLNKLQHQWNIILCYAPLFFIKIADNELIYLPLHTYST